MDILIVRHLHSWFSLVEGILETILTSLHWRSPVQSIWIFSRELQCSSGRVGHSLTRLTTASGHSYLCRKISVPANGISEGSSNRSCYCSLSYPTFTEDQSLKSGHGYSAEPLHRGDGIAMDVEFLEAGEANMVQLLEKFGLSIPVCMLCFVHICN